MGQALYRKYRSKSLGEIIGQEHITDTLAKAIKSGRISHAYLFTGPKGVGKTSIARILAHEINGLPYDDEQAHIDIIEIDAASNRRIDEIRELRDKIHVAPALAKYKIYIIDEVHMLTREAFNALLKTLEEPPAHAIFILATTEAHKLPETIVSRTQRYIFRPIESPQAVAHLRSIATKEKIAITDEALELIAAHGNGSFRDSISLLDQLGGSSKEIDLATVQQVLGIAPTEAVQNLLQQLKSGGSGATIYQQLCALFDQGYQAASIAKQLAAQVRAELVAGGSATTNDIALLQSLLEVPLAHDPEASLEVSLFGYTAVQSPIALQPQLSQAPAPIATPTPQVATQSAPPPAAESKPKPVATVKSAQVVEPIPEPQQEAQNPSATDTPPEPNRANTNATLDPETWQQVLDILKKQHNTLYGIVRMAQPDFSKPGALLLSFSFAFHQKRANEAKNRKAIADAVGTVLGSDLEISCAHDPEAKAAQPVLAGNATSATTDSAADNPLSTISNIFGSVEMVE